MRRFFIALLIFIPALLKAQKASISEEEKTFVTYPFNDPNPVPALTDAKASKIYPYFKFDGYSTKGISQKWKVVKLENDYIVVYVMPEAGGKVWGAIEKSTGKEFIYGNDVMKFRNVAWRGPWASGGIEFNFGIIGHTPSTASSVDYKTYENVDGSVSCVVGNLDLPSRTHWNVEIRLPKDKAYFETNVNWYNPTPLSQSYYNWMTGAAKVAHDLEFFYPGKDYLDHDGKAHNWPIDGQGRNLAKYAENSFGTNKSYHITGEYNDFMGGYYHNEKFGFGHWALYDDMPGHKLWLWSLAREGGIWEDLLTDANGQYMEFQSGRLFNQYSPSAFRTPITQVGFQQGGTERWSEIWFPVKEIGGLTEVSKMGILNVLVKNDVLEIGINALAFAEGKIVLRSGETVLYTEDRKFKPMDIFKKQIPLPKNTPFELIVEGMDLKFDSRKKDLLKRPFTSESNTYSTTSESQLYKQGLELKEYRAYEGAKAAFEECLAKDSLHIGAMVGLSELYYRSAKYDSALNYINKALRLDTYHPAANYQAGNVYRAQGDLINALECFGWAARSMEFRSAAYAQMAAITFLRNDLTLTEHYGRQSLDYNQYNITALQVLALKSRKLGEKKSQSDILDRIMLVDPLSYFVSYEKYLLNPSAENFSKFSVSIKNEFPFQTYLELALNYLELGDKTEAIELLGKAPSNPLVSLWLAYLKNDTTNLSAVASASAAFVFPYRRETLAVLNWATGANNSWKFKYYLSLNLMALNRDAEGIALLKACGEQPDYSPFYLFRAAVLKGQGNQSLADLKHAYQLSPNDWRSSDKLIGYYENAKDNNQALLIATKAYKQFKDNYNIGLRYAKQLLNTGKYEACIQVLNRIHILPFEGAGEGKVVFEQAYLLQALAGIKNKQYKQALVMIEKSLAWPEHLGVGKPYDPDIKIQDYLKAYCLNKLGNTKGTIQWNGDKTDKYPMVIKEIKALGL